MVNSILCLYAAYEKNEEYRENIRRFMECGGLLPHVDYIILVNGKITVDLPSDQLNVKIIHRENTGYDFGAWAEGVANIDRAYDHYIFVNTSVRGPYTRTHGSDWTAPLINLLNQDIHLAGLTINVCTFPITIPNHAIYSSRPVRPHVQSMVFATDKSGFNALRNGGIFDPIPASWTFLDILLNREFGMSAVIFEAGWNISCLAKKYQGFDYRTITYNPNNDRKFGDPFYPGEYFGGTVDVQEIMFYKTERIIPPPDQLSD